MEKVAKIETMMSYLANDSERPATYMYEPPPGKPRRLGNYSTFPLTILNGRDVAGQLTLDSQGFMLRSHETKINDFYDADEVRAIYYPEIEQLMKDSLGVTKVVVFDHNVRCATKAQKKESNANMPVMMAHNDYTLKSGPQRVRDLVGEEEAARLLPYRFLQVNIWRPIRGPVESNPLAVCDAQSMTLQDFVPTDLIYEDRIGEVYSVAYNPHHRWFYFPRMQRNEVLFLKGYDSAEDGRARFTAHSSFDDPTTPPGAPARESIETRTFAFFAPEKHA